MRYYMVFLALVGSLAGCSMVPPEPPPCEGEFQPVNVQQLSQGEGRMNKQESAKLCLGGGSHVS